MHLIIQLAEDNVEVTYEVEGVAVCHDTAGITGVLHGFPRRPAGDYLIVKGARLTDVQALPTGEWIVPK